jgi:nicotinamidase-related amidase
MVAHTLPRHIRRAKAGLAVIDVQERLLPAIHERERVIHNTVRLIKGAVSLQLPILVTEQYRKGIGPTPPEIAGIIAGFAPMEKLTFSACGGEGFLRNIEAKKLEDIILCGIECHVCVCQTCLDLLDRGLRPFVVADAVSSRTVENHNLGLDRMREAGAIIVSTEMILFELLERAGTEEFRQVLPLIK